MLQSADRPIEDVVKVFASAGVESGFIVPTETGLAKSILDAHAQLRDFLRRKGVHDYDQQLQGPQGKSVVKAWLLGLSSKSLITASLYRPETKSGDPRIWFSGLGSYAQSGNLLAIFAHGGELFVANTSSPGVLESATDPTSPLGELLSEIQTEENEPVRDLLSRLRDIASRGPVLTKRSGPTGVGMTLETLLGIKANSSKSPDYRGIEIKASRTNAGGRQSRTTLFSKVPDWEASAVQQSALLVGRYGYPRKEDGRLQLYCSMNNVPNTLGLFLSVRENNLHAVHGTLEIQEKVVQWSLDGLRTALSEKHQQTFWVKAVAHKSSKGEEYFQYTEVVHTRAPMLGNLEALLGTGHIELDFLLYLMKRNPGQKPRTRDHGYLFKINPKDISLLFPPSVVYNLRVELE